MDSTELVKHEESLIKYANSSIHLLQDQSLIMHVKSLQPQKVLFDFFEATEPYNQLEEC